MSVSVVATAVPSMSTFSVSACSFCIAAWAPGYSAKSVAICRAEAAPPATP